MLRTITVEPALAALAVVLASAVAHANPAGVVPTVVDVEVDYEYERNRAQITREQVGDPDADPTGPVPRVRDLEYRQSRHVLTPKLALGTHGVWLSVAVPVVLADSRELVLADGVARDGSSTIAAGYVPPAGYDARAPGMASGDELVMRGINRSGIGEVRGGIGWAPMIQAVDDTKPTWKLGVELRYAIGKLMTFDVFAPARETGVSTGVHELRAWTSVDRRYRYAEAWFEAFYQRALFTDNESLFADPPRGAAHTELMPTAGLGFGVEGYLINDGAKGTRLTVELAARFVAHLEGRGYSELWEMFALAGDPRISGPLSLDADPATPGEQPRRHPGISNIENYLESTARLAVRARIGPHLAFAARGDVVWKTDHLISFADANPGNPLYQPRIDLAGHRYQSQDSRGYVLGAELQLLY